MKQVVLTTMIRWLDSRITWYFAGRASHKRVDQLTIEPSGWVDECQEVLVQRLDRPAAICHLVFYSWETSS
jgi:hypothetical protein